MTEPLALVFYEKLLPGTQLVNRLQDLKYRVQTVSDADSLVECAQESKPMVVLADLISTKNNVCNAIARLKENSQTRHLPVIAFAPENEGELQKSAQFAGATLVASETAILLHLPQFLDQVLQVE
jgi:CheY-like chemotaxis protein